MTSAPILRSSALQKALALAPVKRTPAGGTFASTLAQAQAPSTTAAQTRGQAITGGTRSSLAAAWSAASHLSAGTSPTLSTAPAASVVAIDASAGVPFKDMLTAAANKYGVEPALLAGLVKQESNFNPLAHSGVGAKGLTQLMDSTARGLGVSDSFDPAQSLEGGAKFLGGLLKQFRGDESLALAAYNAGPGAVQKYGGIPPYEETRRYVPKVLGYASQFRRIWADSTGTSATPLQSN